MTPEKCPGCGTKLSPEMLACPNCPMSFPEDEPAGGGNPLKQSPYWNFVLPVVFFGALAAGIWYIAIGLFHLGEEGAKSVDEKPNFLRSAAEEKKAAESAKSGDERAVFEPAGPDGGPSSPHARPDGASGKGPETTLISITPVEPAATGPRAAPPPPRAAAVKEWKLRGRVYDLATLKPVAGASVEFVDEASNARRQTRTDAAGTYRMIIPPLDGRGYAVKIGKRGYSSNYLDPATPGVRELTAADRRALAKDLSATLTATPATLAAETAEPVVTDFYLAPRP